MGKVYDSIDGPILELIQNQKMFFVATAPNESEGHINLSPKGLDSFRVLDGTTVAYLDLVGSGIETIAHLKQNGRIVLMFCTFEGKPKIVRLYGKGRGIVPGEDGFEELIKLFPEMPGVRSIIRVECSRIADSCGWGVPLYEFQGHRSELVDSAAKKGPEALEEYKKVKNASSIDGLEGV